MSLASKQYGTTGRDLARFLKLLQSFQCQKVPCDLLIRACESRPTWSSTGEIIDRLPLEAGVCEWLVDFYNVNKLLLHGAELGDYKAYIKYTTEIDGVAYLEVTSEGQRDLEVIDERILAHERIGIILQAFPSINAEIIGEEIIDRLMDVVKASILPLLSSLTEADIEDWLLPKLPKEREFFLVSMVELLYQVIDRLGIENPLIPMPLLGQLSTVMANQTVANIPIVLSKISQVLDAYNGNNSLQSSFRSSGTRTDQRSNALIGYILLKLLANEESICKPQAPAESLAGALSYWRPLSLSKPSTMEYLAASMFCSRTRINMIGKPSFITVDTIALQGLLLSRGKEHKDAAELLSSTMGAITLQYGPCSLQLGIVTAELANCYNILRQENKAESCVRTTLQGREGSSLFTRHDTIYLDLALADSLIGRARYSEVVPVLKRIVYNPDISAAFRMMGTLRLAKSRRRMHEDTQKAFEDHSPLRTGLTLLSHVPQILTMEYVEELACGISEIPNLQLQGSERVQDLIEGVNSLLKKDGKPSSLTNGPSWDYFSNVQHGFYRRILKHTDLSMGRQGGKHEKGDDKSDVDITAFSQPSPCLPLRANADISDKEGPWSERLVLSFDGGGVRALSSLLILKRIMYQIRELEISHPDGPAYSSSSYPWMGNRHGLPTRPVEPGRADEFLPCHYFDYMAGVSSGGLSGIILGRLRMSVDEAIYRFIDYGNHVYGDRLSFQQRSKFLSPRTKYSAAQVDDVLERLRRKYERMRQEEGERKSLDVYGERFRCNGLGTRTMVLSWCIAESPRHVIWRSYNSRIWDVRLSYEATIWQVARITCATPPYFDAIVVNGLSVLDGAAVTNNPSHSALKEIWSQHAKAPAIFVSLGAGQIGSVFLEARDTSKYKSWPHLKSLLENKIDTETETKDWLNLAKCMGLDLAYRLDPGAALAEIPFDHWGTTVGEGRDTFEDIKRVTYAYLDTADVKSIIDSIAKEAVRIRRARAQTERWEDFAINVEYSCVLCTGIAENLVFSCRTDLRVHLERSHEDWEMPDEAIESFLNAARRYKGRTSFGTG